MFYKPNVREQDDSRMFSGYRYHWNNDNASYGTPKTSGGTISRISNVMSFQQSQIKDDHYTFQELSRKRRRTAETVEKQQSRTNLEKTIPEKLSTKPINEAD